jgi:hypothetical protein
MNVEAVVGQVDGDAAHRLGDFAVFPAVENAASIGPEGYDVAQDFELGKRFEDDGLVALLDAFYRCCETTETWDTESVYAWIVWKFFAIPAPTMMTLIPVLDFTPLACVPFV